MQLNKGVVWLELKSATEKVIENNTNSNRDLWQSECRT